MKEAVIYARTNNLDQDINQQIEVCSQYANENKYKIANIYMDKGFSGNDINRSSLGELKDHLKHNPGSTIIVQTVDRLYRDSELFYRFLIFANMLNARIIGVKGGFDSSDLSQDKLLELKLSLKINDEV